MGKISKLINQLMKKKQKPAPKSVPPKKAEKNPKAEVKAEAKQKPALVSKTSGKEKVEEKPGKGKGKKGQSASNGQPRVAQNQGTTLESRNICRVIGCLLPATSAGYSRNCYIKYWRHIKKKEEILKEGTLHGYIREIVDKYPERIVVAIQLDLSGDEAYAQMIRELDLYGGVDELEHELASREEDLDMEESLDDIKPNIAKDDEEF